jgi:hypothetical protein
MPTVSPLSCPLTLFLVSMVATQLFERTLPIPNTLSDAVSRRQHWQGSQDSKKFHDAGLVGRKLVKMGQSLYAK